jgi:hypothetical protein
MVRARMSAAPAVVDTADAAVAVDIRTTPAKRHGPAHRRTVAWAVAASDALCATAAVVFAYLAVRPDDFGSGRVAALVIGAVLLWVGAFRLFGLHDVLRLSAFEEFRRAVTATCVAATAVMLLLWSESATTRAALGVSLAVGIVAELGVRRLWRWNVRRLRRDGYLTMRTVHGHRRAQRRSRRSGDDAVEPRARLRHRRFRCVR